MCQVQQRTCGLKTSPMFIPVWSPLLFQGKTTDLMGLLQDINNITQF